MAQTEFTQSDYYIILLTAQNVIQQHVQRFASLDYTRSVNVPGVMTLVLPLSQVDISLLGRDTRFEIWRSLSGTAYLETNTQWVLRKRDISLDNQTVTIRAESSLTLLDRRVVAYNSGTSQTSKADNADNMIVEFVKENIGGSAADDDRNWSSDIVISDATGGGPVVNKSASRRNLLTTIQDVARQANVQGTPVFFDMEYRPVQKNYLFRTYLNQRGSDRSTGANKITFSSEYGNLASIIRSDDFSGEATYIYAAGQGRAADRIVATASDQSRIDSSPFGRIERVRDSRLSACTDELQAEADSSLQISRPVRTLTGRIISRPGSLYGLDWFWGDKVAVEFRGEVFTARIDTVNISLRNGAEKIDASIRIDD